MLIKLFVVLTLGINSMAALAISNAELFVYAQTTYPTIFTGSAISGTYLQYNFNYYAESQNYLAVDNNSHIFMKGPFTNGIISEVGAVTDYQNAFRRFIDQVGPPGPMGPQGLTGPAGVSSSCTPYYLGETGPDGGKVFYLDGTGCHGLEAQSTDASGGKEMTWAVAITTAAAYNNSSDPITGAAGFNCSQTNAQLTPYCWHLPSKPELDYLYSQKFVVGGFANLNYWSSSEFDSDYAWLQSFVYGNQYADLNNLTFPAKAVRAF